MRIHCLSWNKRNTLVTKLLGLAEIVILRRFCSGISVWATREEGTVYLWEKRSDKSFSVTTGKCQPSGPSLQRDTQQALFPTETLDPPVGIFLPTEFQWWSLFVHPSPLSKILFHVHAYGVVKSLCFLNCQGQNRSLYQCSHATLTSRCSKLLSDDVGFLNCAVRVRNGDSIFQTLATSLFENKKKKISVSMHCLSWNIKNILVTN